MKTQTYTGELTQEEINSISNWEDNLKTLKTAEELYNEFLAGIADINIADLQEVITEHDKEIIRVIDEMIKEKTELMNKSTVIDEYEYQILALNELKQKLEAK